MPKSRMSAGYWILFLMIVFFIGLRSLLHQDTPPEEILILLDRPPNALNRSQSPDITARRILPLLEESRYSLRDEGSLNDFVLIPPSPSSPVLHFKVVRDDLTRGLLFGAGKADVLYDSLSLAKTAYYRARGEKILSTKGFHLSYLGLNLNHPALSKTGVRHAIHDALPIPEWIQTKYFGYVEAFPFSEPAKGSAHANEWLDHNGFKRGGDGYRFSLRYLTTPVREGMELALLVREALEKIHIRLEVIPLEPSLFFSKLNRSDFDLFGSRILRSLENDPVSDFFASRGRKNYFSYSNPELDRLFLQFPLAGLDKIQEQILVDLPIIPLFTWNHGLLLSRRVNPGDLGPHMDDSFRFLTRLQLN